MIVCLVTAGYESETLTAHVRDHTTKRMMTRLAGEKQLDTGAAIKDPVVNEQEIRSSQITTARFYLPDSF